MSPFPYVRWSAIISSVSSVEHVFCAAFGLLIHATVYLRTDPFLYSPLSQQPVWQEIAAKHVFQMVPSKVLFRSRHIESR